MLLALFLSGAVASISAQTDFAPGEIMFTGYDSDEPDAFSIVLLSDVVSGTDIYITDRGWSNSTGFRVDNFGEGTIKFSFTEDYTCGAEFIFLKNTTPTPDVWVARDINGNIEGTITVESGSDANGPVLGTLGDQLFIYQLPTPTAGNQGSFICMIQMNNDLFGGVDTDEESVIPSGLADDEVVRFNSESDNAEYNCNVIIGTPATLQAAITNANASGGLLLDNENNWTESNFYLTLNGCGMCCGIDAPTLDAPSAVSVNEVFTIEINGSLANGEVWELYTTGCGVGTPSQTTASSSFTVTAPSTEGIVTYYVVSTEDTDCDPNCGQIEVSVCTSTNNMNTCTDCFADPAVCGDCLLPPAADNPDLDSGCYAIKLIFILDESGSIFSPVNYSDSVENGVLAFLDALNGQDIQMALIEFGSTANLVTNYTTINNFLIQNMEGYFNNSSFNGYIYNSSGATNWHDAMVEVDNLEPADIIIFFTDGVPTTYNGDICSPFGVSTHTPDIVNPVKLANKIKSEDSHMFMLGVGSGIDEENLQYMSGLKEYSAGINTIGNSDYSIGNFGDLADDLADFVNELCVTPLVFDKQLLGAVCDGVQQFMFIMHNPGEESAATAIQVIDTFPSGYTNIVYNGPPNIKLCIGSACANQGQPQPDNAFIWSKNSLPPGGSDTLILSVDVLPTGDHTNIGWAQGSNTNLVSDTVSGDLISDDLPPVVTCPADVTVECSDNTLPAGTGSATGTDPDGSTPDVTYDDVIIDGPCTGEFTIERTWVATDGCFNTDTCLQIIFAEDNTAPVLDCPGDVTIECGEDPSPENTGELLATDNCDPLPVITYADVTVSASCGLTIERTWTAEDDCGNSSTCLQVIVIDDTEGPGITCPANVTISCTESTLPANTGGSATATDSCDPSPEIDYADNVAAGMCTQEMIITRTWIATDACGNTTTCNQLIHITDTQDPAITCPADVTIECSESTLPANTGMASSTDNCDPSPVMTFTNSTTPGACAQEYTITRTWTATDACGNNSMCIQLITVVDNTPPVITCPSNVTIACTDSTLPSGTGSAGLSDTCDPAAFLTYTDVTIAGGCLHAYSIERTWIAEDDCGNSSACTQIIFVEDSTDPDLTCPPNVTIECTSSTLPENTGTATSMDNCDPSPFVEYADVTVAGSCGQAYTITRTWTSTDTCGNETICTQTITIVDTTPPVITCPADITIECTDSTLPDSTGVAGATDACDPAPELDYNDATFSGPSPDGYTIERTWTSTDSCGNSSTCLQIIIVENPVDPEITGFEFDTICSGESVTLTAEEQGFPNTTYDWIFGSGASPASGMGIGPHMPVYVYNATNGSTGALVVLTVSVEGCASVTDTVANIHVNAIPNPAIDAPTSNLCYFKFRSFKPLEAEMAGFDYEWDFGPGASLPPTNGYGPHNVKYSTTGTKTVRLIVHSNEAGASCADTGFLTFNVISCPGNITGRVRRPDGTGIGGVNVRLYRDDDLDGQPDGTFIRSVFTTSTGLYSIVNLVPGQYVIGQVDLPNYYSVMDLDETNDNDTIVPSDPNDNLIPVTLEPSEVDADNVFVDAVSPGIINGYVFEDHNNNGLPEAGEGIAGVSIQLHTDVDQDGTADPGGLVAETITSSIGFYVFSEVENADYVLTEMQPAGYNNVKDIDLTEDGDVVPNTNMTNDTLPVTIANGETDSHNFFKESTTCGQFVTNTNDSGPGSLRYILDCTASGDTIGFHSNLANQVIHLTSERIVFDKEIYLHSTLSPRVRIHSDIPGAFLISPGYLVEFKNINFTSGLSGHPGAAFENYGMLILWDSNILKNALLLPGNTLIYNGNEGMLTAKGIIQIELD